MEERREQIGFLPQGSRLDGTILVAAYSKSILVFLIDLDILFSTLAIDLCWYLFDNVYSILVTVHNCETRVCSLIEQ